MSEVSTSVNGGQFFSVKYRSTINSYDYRPAVCYKLTNSLQATVEAMAAEGAARIYPKEVRFISGVAYPVKKPEAEKPSAQAAALAPIVAVSGASDPVTAPTQGKKGSRRAGFVGQTGGSKEFS